MNMNQSDFKLQFSLMRMRQSFVLPAAVTWLLAFPSAMSRYILMVWSRWLARQW